MPKASNKKKVDPPAGPEAPSAAEPKADLSAKAAEEAFKAFKPRLLGLDTNELGTVSVDLEKGSVAIAAVGRWVKGKEPRARFAALPKQHFDQAHVDDLESLALATWHTAVSLRSATAGRSEAKLPVSLVQEATQIKQRMLELCDYHFGSGPVDGPEIADIKLGTGYTDLAGDLVRLGKLYAKHRDHVKLDPKNYRKTDEADAGRVAHAIFRELGEARNQDQKTWTDLALRAYTLLARVYGEVSAAGSWLWRHEDAAVRFPSLYVVGRPTPTKTAAKSPAGSSESKIEPAGDPSTGSPT